MFDANLPLYLTVSLCASVWPLGGREGGGGGRHHSSPASLQLQHTVLCHHNMTTFSKILTKTPHTSSVSMLVRYGVSAQTLVCSLPQCLFQLYCMSSQELALHVHH